MSNIITQRITIPMNRRVTTDKWSGYAIAPCTFDVSVNLLMLVAQLGRKAIDNKSRKTKIAHGAIAIEFIPKGGGS